MQALEMRFRWIWVSSLLPMVIGCSTLGHTPGFPMYIPFDFAQAGKTTTAKFILHQKEVVNFSIFFSLRPSQVVTHDEQNSIFGGHTVNKCGWTEQGIATPIRIQLKRTAADAESTLFDEQVLPKTGSAGHGYLSRSVLETILNPGEFRLSFTPGEAGTGHEKFDAQMVVYLGGWKIAPLKVAKEGGVLKFEQKEEYKCP